ncbi:MAG: sigma-70 family RNA polymerase sigma factor [Pirellulaceae bacterium]|nr:sigma-70 family RNA polymerase sigma factor [Pirellulaceae bacterium]
MKRTRQQTEGDLDRHRPILISLAEALLSPALRGHVDASDLVQQTLMEAHGNIEELGKLDDAPLLAWLRSALKHNVLDAVRHLRTAKNNVARNLRLGDLQNSFVRLEQLLVADDTSPSQVVQRNEDITYMLAALQTLPSNQKMAVILKHLRGHTLKEVSEMLEVSESAVAGLLHRGRQQLLHRMQEDRDE